MFDGLDKLEKLMKRQTKALETIADVLSDINERLKTTGFHMVEDEDDG